MKPRTSDGLAKDLIVVCVAADPEPHETVGRFDREGPMMTPNPRRPESTHLPEVQGRMLRVVFQVTVGSIGEPLDLWRQGAVAGPEIG
jgi:hypothetical protein